MVVFKGKENINPIDLNLEDFFGSSPKTVINDKTIQIDLKEPKYYQNLFIKYLENVLSLESVSCKDWLTNKVDRCVTGRVALQQAVGEIQLPLNNLGIMALDFSSNKGIATTVGFHQLYLLLMKKLDLSILFLRP